MSDIRQNFRSGEKVKVVRDKWWRRNKKTKTKTKAYLRFGSCVQPRECNKATSHLDYFCQIATMQSKPNDERVGVGCESKSAAFDAYSTERGVRMNRGRSAPILIYPAATQFPEVSAAVFTCRRARTPPRRNLCFDFVFWEFRALVPHPGSWNFNQQRMAIFGKYFFSYASRRTRTSAYR